MAVAQPVSWSEERGFGDEDVHTADGQGTTTATVSLNGLEFH